MVFLIIRAYHEGIVWSLHESVGSEIHDHLLSMGGILVTKTGSVM